MHIVDQFEMPSSQFNVNSRQAERGSKVQSNIRSAFEEDDYIPRQKTAYVEFVPGQKGT